MSPRKIAYKIHQTIAVTTATVPGPQDHAPRPRYCVGKQYPERQEDGSFICLCSACGHEYQCDQSYGILICCERCLYETKKIPVPNGVRAARTFRRAAQMFIMGLGSNAYE